MLSQGNGKDWYRRRRTQRRYTPKGRHTAQQGAAGNNSSREHREAARGGSGTIESTHETEQYKT